MPPPREANPRGHGKGWWFLKDSELSHRGLTACLKGNDTFGAATAIPRGPAKTNSGKFSLLSHGKSWGRPHTAAVNHPHVLPATRAGMGTGIGTCPHRHSWPLPCSKAAAGLTVQLVMGARAGVLPCRMGASTLSPAARLDAAPEEDVAMPGPIPAPGRTVGSACASGVRGSSQPCGRPCTRGQKGGGELGGARLRDVAQGSPRTWGCRAGLDAGPAAGFGTDRGWLVV